MFVLQKDVYIEQFSKICQPRLLRTPSVTTLKSLFLEHKFALLLQCLQPIIDVPLSKFSLISCERKLFLSSNHVLA
jgi:hypothetical protein